MLYFYNLYKSDSLINLDDSDYICILDCESFIYSINGFRIKDKKEDCLEDYIFEVFDSIKKCKVAYTFCEFYDLYSSGAIWGSFHTVYKVPNNFIYLTDYAEPIDFEGNSTNLWSVLIDRLNKNQIDFDGVSEDVLKLDGFGSFKLLQGVEKFRMQFGKMKMLGVV